MEELTELRKSMERLNKVITFAILLVLVIYLVAVYLLINL
jgi:hypothetical protein